jgi:hypothetical protein
METGFTKLFDGRTLAGGTVERGPETGSTSTIGTSSSVTVRTSRRSYENFDVHRKFFIKGCVNAGIYLHAAQRGWKTGDLSPTEPKPRPESNGALFLLVRWAKGMWGTTASGALFGSSWIGQGFQAWMNREEVQSPDPSANPELRYRLRRRLFADGARYNEFESQSGFCNFRVQELSTDDNWQPLYYSS